MLCSLTEFYGIEKTPSIMRKRLLETLIGTLTALLTAAPGSLSIPGRRKYGIWNELSVHRNSIWEQLIVRLNFLQRLVIRTPNKCEQMAKG